MRIEKGCLVTGEVEKIGFIARYSWNFLNPLSVFVRQSGRRVSVFSGVSFLRESEVFESRHPLTRARQLDLMFVVHMD